MKVIDIDLKKYVTHGFRNEFFFHVKRTDNGIACIYINNARTTYCVGGEDTYDKDSAVIAKMINDITVGIKYDKKLFGVVSSTLRLAEGGMGFDSLCTAFNSKRGNKLEHIYDGDNFSVYKIKINKRYLAATKHQ